MRMKSFFAAISAMLLVAGGAHAQPKSMWVTAYYPLWAVPTMYPEVVDFSGVTHVVHFCANPVRQSPYLDVLVPAAAGGFNQDSVNIQWGGTYNGNNPPLWRTIDVQKTLIARAHEHGAKVLLSVGGIYGEGAKSMSYIAEENARIDMFVTAACAYAQRKGYDGIELDWEFPLAGERDRYVRLIMRFREELNKWKQRGLFVTAVYHSPGAKQGYDRESMVAAFDQINLMTYEMFNGNWSDVHTGYNTPIDRPDGYPMYSGYALNDEGHGLSAWTKFGVPVSKLGLGISFLTTEFYKVRPPVQPGQKFGWKNWGYVKNIRADGRHWDAKAKVPWQASGSTFITYEDTLSVKLKMEYARNAGVGGIMVYDLLGGYAPNLPKGRSHELLRVVTKAIRIRESVKK